MDQIEADAFYHYINYGAQDLFKERDIKAGHGKMMSRLFQNEGKKEVVSIDNNFKGPIQAFCGHRALLELLSTHI